MALRIIIIFAFIFSTNIIFGQNLWQLQRGTETGQVPITQGQHHIMEFINLADYVADSLGLVQTQLEMRGDSICVVGGNCVMDVDPVFMGHLSYNITAADTARWGDHFSGLFTDLDFTGTVGMSDGVDNVDDADNNPSNELQTLNISGHEISISNGNTITIPAGTDDQAISLSGNILTLEDGGTVDLTPYLDNTDDQVISISNDTLFLENGGFIVLPEDLDNNPTNEIQSIFAPTITPETYLLQLSHGGGGVNLSILYDNTDEQAISISNDTIFLENGGFVVLPEDQAGTDDQAISLSGNILTLEDGGTVDLSPYLDNTDNQTLGRSNDTIYIENGGFVVLPEDQVDDADNDPTNERQLLSLNNSLLGISNGNWINLAPFLDNTDDQAISISNDTIFLESGGFIVLPGGSSLTLDGNSLIKCKDTVTYSLYFDGVNDFVQARDPSVFDVTTGDFDMEVEYTTDTIASGSRMRLLEKRGQGSQYSPASYQLSTLDASLGNTGITDSKGNYLGFLGSDFQNVPFLSDGLWHNIQYTWVNSTGTASIFVDGVLASQITDPSMIGQSIGTSRLFTVGAANTDDQYFEGKIKYFRFGSEVFPLNEGQGAIVTGTEGTVLDIYGATWVVNENVCDTIDLQDINTDDQLITWNGATGDLSIEDGNAVNIDGRYLGINDEADPIFTGHLANDITPSDTTKWGYQQLLSTEEDTIFISEGNFILSDNDPTNEVDIYKSNSFSTIVAEAGKWRWITGSQGSPDTGDYIGFSIPDHGLADNHMAQLAWRDKDFFWRTAEDSNLNPWKRVYTEWDFSESDILNWEAAYNWGDHSTQGYLDNTDDQAISISNNILTLEDGGTVDLTPYLDNTDDQVISISNDTLYLENGGFAVLPEDQVDDADNDPTNELQELTMVSTNALSISGGNTVYLPENQEIELQQDTLLTLSDAFNKINISSWIEDDQAISLSGNILTLEDGGTVDLSPYLDNTDDQAISISNDTLFLEDGGFVVLPAGGGGSASDFVVNGIEYTDGDTINTFLYNDEYGETIFDHIRQPYYTTDNPNEVLKNGNRLEITEVDTTLKRFKINRDLNTMDLTRGVNNRNWHFVSRTTSSGGQLGSIHGEVIDVDYAGGYLYYDTYYPAAGTGHPTVGHYVELINPFINYEITHNEQPVFPQIAKGQSFQGRTVDYNIPATTQRLDDNSFVTVVDVRFTNGDSEGYLATSPDGLVWTLTNTVLYDNSVYPGISMNEIVKIPNDQGSLSGKYLCIMRMDPVDFGGYMIFDADFTQEVGLTEFPLNQSNEFNLFRPTLRAAVFHEGKIRFAMVDLESNKADRKIIEYIYEGKLDRILSGAADESEFTVKEIIPMNTSSNPDMTNGVHDIYGYLTDGDKLVLTTGYETWAGLIHHQKRMFVGLILSEDGTWKLPHSPYLVTSPILYRLLDQHRGTTEYVDFEDRMGMGEIFKKGDDYFCFATMSSVQTNDYQSFLLRLTPPEVQVLTKRGDTIGISYGNEIVLNDDDPENELQVLNLSNDTLSISGGNSIVLPAGGGGGFSGLYEALDFSGTSGLSDGVDDVNDADSNPTNEIQTISSSVSGTNRTISLSGSNGTTFSIADNDNSSSNEMQNLSLNGNTLSISGGNAVNLPTGGAGTDLSNSISGDLVTIQSSTGTNTTFSRADGDSDAGNELSNLQVFTFSGNPRLFDSNGDGVGVDFIGLGGLSLSSSGNDIFLDASGIGGGGDFSAQMVSGQARVYNTNGDDFFLDDGEGLNVTASGDTVTYSVDRVNTLYNIVSASINNGSTAILDIGLIVLGDDITVSAGGDTFTPQVSGVYKIEVRQLNPLLTYSVRYNSNNNIIDSVVDTDNAVLYVDVSSGTTLHIAASNTSGSTQNVTIGSAKVYIERIAP